MADLKALAQKLNDPDFLKQALGDDGLTESLREYEGKPDSLGRRRCYTDQTQKQREKCPPKEKPAKKERKKAAAKEPVTPKVKKPVAPKAKKPPKVKPVPHDPVDLKQQFNDLLDKPTDENDIQARAQVIEQAVNHAVAHLTNPQLADWAAKALGVRSYGRITKARFVQQIKDKLHSQVKYAGHRLDHRRADAQAKLAQHPDYLEHVKLSKLHWAHPLSPQEFHDLQNMDHSTPGPDADKQHRDDQERQPRRPASEVLGNDEYQNAELVGEPTKYTRPVRPTQSQKQNALNIRAYIDIDLTPEEADKLIKLATGSDGRDEQVDTTSTNRNKLEELAKEFGVPTHMKSPKGAFKREWNLARDPADIHDDLVQAMLAHVQKQHAEHLARQESRRRRKKMLKA